MVELLYKLKSMWKGEGDCDSDADCIGNLKCGQGNGFDDNCGSGFPSDADCCYDPNKQSGCHDGKGEWWNCCTSSNQCGEGEGDCDSDADCIGNLKCGHDNCNTALGFASNADCCYGPDDTNPTNPTGPTGPTGPAGKIFKYDLLKPHSGGRLGAFNTVDWPRGKVNNEVQYYKHQNAVQDPVTGEITITAEKRSSGKIYSARLESYKVWTTAQSSDIKKRGYVEVRALYPSKVHGGNLKGAWPAIWMLGKGNGHNWPHHGEIDIMEAKNGNPKIYMSTHSTKHKGVMHSTLDPASMSMQTSLKIL